MIESVARLRGDQLTLGYGKFTVAENLNVSPQLSGQTAAENQHYCARLVV